MNRIYYYNFAPETFDDQPEQTDQTIHLHYNPVNFQHLSLIARMFNPDFTNHCDRGDISGIASAVEALPYITFELPAKHIRVQFAADTDDTSDADLRSFVQAAPADVEVHWSDTLIWRQDAEGKICERWQAPLDCRI